MGFDKAKAIRAAEKYLASGKIPSAIQEYSRIVEHDADDFNALNTLGDLYTRVDKRAEAAACYRRVAEHYREQGFTLKAVAMYKKLTRHAPEDHQTALALASLYEQQGLMVDARQHYLIAADAFTRAGNTRDALDVLRRIADLDPSNTDIRLRLAQSYVAEKLPDLAAEAYAEAGARLAARKEFEGALDAFTKSLALRPAAHAALHGLLSAHAELGTADEAAEVLEQVVKERPGDLEVRAMLARAYVDAEDAERAEAATRELVGRDPSSFMLLFDVARLHLRRGDTDTAARLLDYVAEPALAARQESALAELLQEVLARNPEQMDAHRLLVRAYTSSHDDANLRAALERLADAAEATGTVEDERRARTLLARLASGDEANLARLEELGGPLFDESGAPGADAPTFESFMLNDDGAAAREQPAAAPSSSTPSAEFEWNSVAEPPAAGASPDASASFADLNDLTDGGQAPEPDERPVPKYQPPQAGFQEFDFSAPPAEPAGADPGSSVEHMLRQELESVDFYIEQGYSDIARDTLDMLERQYGAHPEIDVLRGRLGPAEDFGAARADSAPPVYDPSAGFDTPVAFEPNAAPAPSTAPEAFDAAAFEIPGGFETADPGAGAEAPASFEMPASYESAAGNTAAETPRPPSANSAAGANNAGAGEGGTGIDPGLAAIFDEFREAVEDGGEEESGGDFDTHYQMGLAYREMGLLDQAVEEFQTAAGQVAAGDGTPRFLQCCNMLGHCFMEKGMPRPAALWFKRGLDVPGHSEDEYQAMRYDLGTAYERMGDNGRAIEVLSEVYAIDVSYRGVAERLRELQKTVNREP
ncbi:MAG TPA: tetratricopeptide repeat protein [Pyrinomonadaceae bacterium]|jgi:tetratricopeptide (TPR) repeat protein